MNYAALAWLSPDSTTSSNGITWLELTLAGGEIILFGQGIIANGATIVLPAGFTRAQCFAVAEMHDGPTSGSNVAHMLGAYVDANLMVHYDITDGSGNDWHGNASVLVFAWKNNMGTVTKQALGGGNWIEIPLSDGTNFGAGCALNMADGATLKLPAAAGDGSTLEVITGSHNGLPEAGTNHTQGIGACYLDADNIIHIFFKGAPGVTWSGTADVFGIYRTPGAAAPTLVRVTPASATIAAGTTMQFTATVTGNTNPNIVWSVDGIAGGNVTVGTISAAGVYAPNLAGSHTVATSIADPAAKGTAAVTVFGPPSSSLPPERSDSDGRHRPLHLPEWRRNIRRGGLMATPTIPLSSVLMAGLYAAIPAAGMGGRVYFTTDTNAIWYDNGAAWENVTPTPVAPLSVTSLALAAAAPGNFTVAHGLSAAPSAVTISMTSSGQIWLQSPTSYDATSIYLTASDASVTGKAILFH